MDLRLSFLAFLSPLFFHLISHLLSEFGPSPSETADEVSIPPRLGKWRPDRFGIIRLRQEMDRKLKFDRRRAWRVNPFIKHGGDCSFLHPRPIGTYSLPNPEKRQHVTHKALILGLQSLFIDQYAFVDRGTSLAALISAR